MKDNLRHDPRMTLNENAIPKNGVSLLVSGANERIRTADLLITSELLYQLSYVGSYRFLPAAEM